MAKLLEGITVVAASLAEAGPVATQILALLGADVYHIERPSKTMEQAIFNHDGLLIRNCNKKSLTLDTKTEEGREIMWKLLEKADVFYENFAPGAWERMGFSYEEVKKRNPDIIYVTLKGFSSYSPWAKCIAIDPIACTSGGSAYLSGYEDFLPMLCAINVGDSGAGIHSGLAVLLALLHKKVTGRGQFVETPMQESVAAECRRAFAEYYATGNVRRAGNSYRGVKPTAPWNLYPTQGSDITGNFVAITCSPEEDSPDFENLCRAMDRMDLLEDPRFATPALRYENRLALDVEISHWTYRFDKEEVMRVLGLEYKVPVGMVRSLAELRDDPLLNRELGIIQKPEGDPLFPDMVFPVIPVQASGIEPIKAMSYRFHGSSNEEVYHGMLGLSLEQLSEMKEKHII